MQMFRNNALPEVLQTYQNVLSLSL